MFVIVGHFPEHNAHSVALLIFTSFIYF